MGIVDTFKRSWELTKLSWHVLMQDKELLVFPVLSAIGAVALFIGIVVPSFLVPFLNPESGAAVYYGGLILWYFLTSFIAIFFQAALIACVKMRLHGGNPTIGYGLKEAGKRIIPIIGWSLISATVGIILRILSDQAKERGGIVGIVAQIILSIVGFAWAIVTMFMVPVIVLENQGVFASFKRSAELVKKTWGEQIVMTAGLGAVFMAAYVSIMVVCVLTVFVIPALLIPVVIFGFGLLACTAVLQSTLSGVFNGILYAYARGDKLPAEYKTVAAGAFTKKV